MILNTLTYKINILVDIWQCLQSKVIQLYIVKE